MQERETLAMQKKVLGDEHEDTLLTASNLAASIAWPFLAFLGFYWGFATRNLYNPVIVSRL